MTPSITPTETPPSDNSGSNSPLFLAYVRGEVGETDIYVMDVASRGSWVVAGRGCDEAEPAWSPDSEWIVYQADCGGSYDLYRVNRNGGEPTLLLDGPTTDEREADYSPDGQQIVYRVSAKDQNRNNDGELWLMAADGSNNTNLGVIGRTPVWSPDGSQLVFMSQRSGSWQIYRYTFATGAVQQLTACAVDCRWPAWSPDGQWVAYHTMTALGSSTPDTIWYVAVSGGSPKAVVSGEAAGRPTWSRTGLLAFNSKRGIEMIQPDGTQRQTLVGGGDIHWAPAWSQ